MLVPPVLFFIFSFILGYSYFDVVKSAPFFIIYFLWFITATVGYCASLEEDHKPMSFIK